MKIFFILFCLSFQMAFAQDFRSCVRALANVGMGGVNASNFCHSSASEGFVDCTVSLIRGAEMSTVNAGNFCLSAERENKIPAFSECVIKLVATGSTSVNAGNFCFSDSSSRFSSCVSALSQDAGMGPVNAGNFCNSNSRQDYVECVVNLVKGARMSSVNAGNFCLSAAGKSSLQEFVECTIDLSASMSAVNAGNNCL